MSEKENNIDNLFKGGLDGHKPDAPEGVWGKLSEDLKGERNFHPVDDLFYDRLITNEAKPPLNVWGRIRNGLGNRFDAGIYNSLDGFEHTPPNWIWQSLAFMLLLNRRNRIRRAVVFVTGTLGMLAFISLLQWGLYSTVPSFEVNETKEVHKLNKMKGGEANSRQLEKSNTLMHALGGNQFGSKANNKNKFAKTKDKIRLAKVERQLMVTGGNLAESKSELDLIALSAYPIFRLQSTASSPNANLQTTHFRLRTNVRLSGVKAPSAKRPKIATTSPWSIAFLASANHSFRSLKGAPRNEYLLIRNISEKAKTTLSYALRLKYNLSNHLFVSTGISIVNRGEKAEYDFKTQQEAQTMVGFYINGVYELKPYKYTFTQDYKKNAENSYAYMEVPMAFGYRFDYRYFSIQPTIGVSAGVLTAANGANLTMELNPSLVSLDEVKKQSMNRLNVGGNISVAVSVNMGKKLNFLVEPFYNHSLNNSLINNMDVKQYFHSKGILAGLEWKL